VGKRLCEVTIILNNGTRYTGQVEATSMYQAAILFHRQLTGGRPGLGLAEAGLDSVLEVRPVYRVKLQDAFNWANRQTQKSLMRGKGSRNPKR
jgi:small nuclear ribonucleoprotein (snRNP)-like protein